MKDYIPAGAGERMQYIVHPFNDNTMRYVLRYPFHVQAEALRQATCALAGSVDVLHAAFVSGCVGAGWKIHDVRAEDCFYFISTREDPLTVALNRAKAGIGAGEPVKLRCILVHGEKDSAVTLLISHLCADGSDGKYLLMKLCQAYNLILRTGGSDLLEVKNGCRAAEQVYRHLSRRDKRRLLKDPRAGIRSAFPFPTEEPGKPVVLRRRISSEAMSAAYAQARRAGATRNDVLLTACYHAYAEIEGVDAAAPMSIMSMMDLRRHCQGGESPGLCNLTGALSTFLPMGLHTTFAETLAEIAAQTRSAKADPFAGLYGMPLLHCAARLLPMGVLVAAVSRLYSSLAVTFTNIGRLDSRELLLDGIPPNDAWFGGPIKKKPGMQISCVSLDDVCSLSIWGYAAQEDCVVLQQLLDGVARYVEGAHNEI